MAYAIVGVIALCLPVTAGLPPSAARLRLRELTRRSGRQRFDTGFAAGFVVGAAVGLAAGLAFGVAFGFAFGVTFWFLSTFGFGATFGFGFVFGFTGGFAAGFSGRSSAWTRYYLSVVVNRVRGRGPLRFGAFLDWAQRAGLLRTSGVAYQFRHRELKDWLTSPQGEPER